MNNLPNTVIVRCKKNGQWFKIDIVNNSSSDLIIRSIKFKINLSSEPFFWKLYQYGETNNNSSSIIIKPEMHKTIEFSGATNFGYDKSGKTYLISVESNLGESNSETYTW